MNSGETIKTFVDLVARMRHAQKQYFFHQTTDNLLSAKDLEKQVDGFIEDYQQLRLF